MATKTLARSVQSAPLYPAEHPTVRAGWTFPSELSIIVDFLNAASKEKHPAIRAYFLLQATFALGENSRDLSPATCKRLQRRAMRIGGCAHVGEG